MTTLAATAVISAVDRASAVFMRVGANARALSGKFTAATAGLSRFGQTAAMNLGMPAAMAGGMAARGEYEIDKLARVMQAQGELSDKQREMLSQRAFDVSRATGESAAEILKGQRELILGGLDADTAAATSSIIAKVARANEMAGAKVAEDAITNASALGLAMDTTQNKVASLTKTLDFMSTVPAFSPMNWEDLSTAMKYVGPVAGALKVPMKDLGAALSMLAFAGFKGEEAGTALRTILTRLIAPTRKARVELAAAGIDQSKLFSIDKGKANDKGALFDALVQQGLMTTKERARAERALTKVNYDGKDASAYTTRLNEVLQRVLGLGKGDTQDKEILKTAIDNHLVRAVGDLDMEKVFTAIKDLPLKSLKEMFGLQRLSQAKALANKISEIVKLPNGERVSAWRKLADEIGLAIDGAADRKAVPLLDGFSASIDKAGAALAAMRHQIFASGFGNDVSGLFTRMADSVNTLAQTDPEQLRRVGLAITALATAPLVGTGIAGLTAAMLAFTDLAKAFEEQKTQGLGPAGGIVETRKASPMTEMLTELKGLAAEIGTTLAPITQGLRDLFNINPEGSLLLGGIAKIAEGLRTIKAGVEIFNLSGMQRDAEQQAEENRRLLAERRAAGYTPGRDPIRLPDMRPTMQANGAGDEIQKFIRDGFPNAGMQRVEGQANVTVQGVVQGNMTLDARIQVEGGGHVSEQTTGGGAVSGKLDPGESHLDLKGP